MEHFKERPREFPRFSDRPGIPFWNTEPLPPQLAATAVGVEPARSSPPARSSSEPTLKVTEASRNGLAISEHIRGEANPQPSHLAGHPTEQGRLLRSRVAPRTVPNWTADVIKRGGGHNKKRLFDSIEPIKDAPLDWQSLDLTSSMESIRSAAKERLRLGKDDSKGITANPRRRSLWSEQSHSAASEAARSDPRAITDLVENTNEPLDRRRLMSASVPPANLPTERAEKPREPRFFGGSTRSLSETGVRCGGFLRFECPPVSSPSPQKQERSVIPRSRTGTVNTFKDKALSRSSSRPLSRASSVAGPPL